MPDKDYFELFGISPLLSLDRKTLEQRYFQLSRESHPDLFARKPETERQAALDRAALLNDAYRTLRDPVRRAEYLIGTPDGGSPPPPPELLEEVFEMNMTLEELRSGDGEARSQLEAQKVGFEANLASLDLELNALSARYDAGTAKAAEIRALLDRRKYISNLIHDADKALDAGN